MLRDILFLAKAVHDLGLMSYNFDSFVFCAGIVDKPLWRNSLEKVNVKKVWSLNYLLLK